MMGHHHNVSGERVDIDYANGTLHIISGATREAEAALM